MSPMRAMTVPRWAVASAVLSPVALTAAYLIAGVFQPPSYDPIRQTISGMAGYGGTDRWIMTGGILLVGACYLLTAAGLTGIGPTARPSSTSPGRRSARSSPRSGLPSRDAVPSRALTC